jgi:hypothetical protein
MRKGTEVSPHINQVRIRRGARNEAEGRSIVVVLAQRHFI